MTVGAADASGVYVGYGDINANPGPIDLLKLLKNGSVTTLLSALPTEVINRWRVLNNGYVWVPSIDPRGATPGFLATNTGGTWHTITVGIVGLPVVEHMFDVAQEPNGDLYVCGSHTPDTAFIWRSTNGGSTWTEVFAHASGQPDGYNRFYNFARSNGTLVAIRNNTVRYVLSGGTFVQSDVALDPVPEVYPMHTLPNAGNGWTAAAGPDGEVWLCDGESIYLIPAD